MQDGDLRASGLPPGHEHEGEKLLNRSRQPDLVIGRGGTGVEEEHDLKIVFLLWLIVDCPRWNPSDIR